MLGFATQNFSSIYKFIWQNLTYLWFVRFCQKN